MKCIHDLVDAEDGARVLEHDKQAYRACFIGGVFFLNQLLRSFHHEADIGSFLFVFQFWYVVTKGAFLIPMGMKMKRKIIKVQWDRASLKQQKRRRERKSRKALDGKGKTGGFQMVGFSGFFVAELKIPVKASFQVLSGLNEVLSEGSFRILIIGTPEWRVLAGFEDCRNNGRFILDPAVERIHRIDGKFCIVRRTKKGNVGSLQKRRQGCDRVAITFSAIKPILRSHHDSAVPVLVAKHARIVLIEEIDF